MKQVITQIFFLILFLGSAIAQPIQEQHVFIDTDCGTDDLIAIDLLLNTDKINIVGVSCVHGLTRPDEGARIIRRLFNSYGLTDVPIYRGKGKAMLPTHPFPKQWRKEALQTGYDVTPPTSKMNISAFNANEILSLFKKKNMLLLTLGPLTNIAELITEDEKNILKSIKTIIMGGAINENGNLTAGEVFKSENKTSEWNFYSDPLAAKQTLNYIDEIVLVPLDATSKVKIDSNYLIKENWRHRKKNPSWKVIKKMEKTIKEGNFYAWDPLAAAYLIDHKVLSLTEGAIKVSLKKNERGSTILTDKGKMIKYAKKGNKTRFDKVMLQN